MCDNAIRDLRGRVSFNADARFDDLASAEVRVHLADGTMLTHAIAAFAGSEKNEFSDGDITDAFLCEAGGRLKPDRAQQIVDAVWSLDGAETVIDLISLLEGPLDL